MFKSVILLAFAAIYSVHVSKADLTDDAKVALENARYIVNSTLSTAAKTFFELAADIDKAVFDTKRSGLAKILSETEIMDITVECRRKVVGDLNSCVNTQANVTLDKIFNYSMGTRAHSLAVLYGNEQKIIYCELTDEDCIKSGIANTPTVVEEINTFVHDYIEEFRPNVTAAIEDIKACTNQIIKLEC